MSMADVLARTYWHRLDAFRPLSQNESETVCQNAPCALSRSAVVSAPAPPERAGALPEALYRLNLYTRPELVLQLGDRVEIRDETGRIFRGRSSDSFRYASHCITVVEIAEVLPGEEPNPEAQAEDTE